MNKSTFSEFESALLEALREELGDGVKMQTEKIRKNNGVELDAVVITPDGESLSPTIYLENAFYRYRKGESIRILAGELAEQYRESVGKVRLPNRFFMDYEEAKDKIYCKLINRELNRKLLEDIPGITVLGDLYMVAYYELNSGCRDNALIRIDRRLLERWGISEDVLLTQALTNTIHRRRPVFRGLRSVFEEIGVETPAADENEDEMYMLTTEDRSLGAICIMYPGIAEEMSEALGADLLLFPSSVHEWLVLPDRGGYREWDINRMIREINYTQVDPEEVLSDHVYHLRRGDSYLSISEH